MSQPMKVPGPDHPITITPSRERVRVMLQRQHRRRHQTGAGAAGGEPTSPCSTFRARTRTWRCSSAPPRHVLPVQGRRVVLLDQGRRSRGGERDLELRRALSRDARDQRASGVLSQSRRRDRSDAGLGRVLIKHADRCVCYCLHKRTFGRRRPMSALCQSRKSAGLILAPRFMTSDYGNQRGARAVFLDFNRSSCRASSAASASSHSLNATIFGSFAVAFAQTIQYPKDAGIAISKGRTKRPPTKSHAANAMRLRTTPWPSTAASIAMLA